MSNIKFCKNCRSKNNHDLFYSGYFSWLEDDCYECPMKNCGHTLIDINLSKEDFNVITQISQDVSFIEAMIKLHDTDIIEYETKMSQFRNQVAQQEQIKKQTEESSKPHCPTCGSINIKPITATERATSIIGLGIFSKKINKTYKCLNCKCTW